MPPPLTRRDTLKLASTALLSNFLTTLSASAAEPPPKPTLHVYPDYAWLRGFSVVPSWGARIEEAWWNYDPARFREEVALATTVHANCIRLWIDFTAWMADPDKISAHFFDAVAAIDEHGMKTMPCLFNRWHDLHWDYGGQYIEGFQSLSKRLGKPILANETIPGCLDDLKRAEVAKFYTEMLTEARIGWMGWAMREGKAVSTRRDRYDANGIDSQGFHPFFTKSGKLRDGLEFLTQKPTLLPPWKTNP